MTGRISRLAAAMLAATAVLAVAAGTAGAERVVIYNNIPSPLPGNLPSQSFEATATSEFGGQVQFAGGTTRKNPTVVVTMSSSACQSGNSYEKTCKSENGATFEWPLTVSVYEAGPENSVGAKIAGVSKVFKMPYRPSASTKCTGANEGEWYRMGMCFTGKAFTFKIALGPKVKLPETAIISVAYNTSDYGAEPQRPKPCNETTAGCPYDSLNVGLAAPPSVGTDPLPEDAYISSTNESEYCGSGVATGTFGLSTGCWTGHQPAIETSCTSCSTPPPPHWYSNGTRIAEGLAEPVPTSAGLVLSAPSGQLTVHCSVKDMDTLENPVGGGAGTDELTEFAPLRCSYIRSPKYEETCGGAKPEIIAHKLHWLTHLIPGPPIRDVIAGIELEVKCGNTVFFKFTGTLMPTTGNSLIYFARTGSGELEDPTNHTKATVYGTDDLIGPSGDETITAH